jgi:hypothetical protein
MVCLWLIAPNVRLASFRKRSNTKNETKLRFGFNPSVVKVEINNKRAFTGATFWLVLILGR